MARFMRPKKVALSPLSVALPRRAVRRGGNHRESGEELLGLQAGIGPGGGVVHPLGGRP